MGGCCVERDVVERDRSSFDRFFREEQAALLRYCGPTTDPDSSRDVAQEAMTRAWKDWAQLEGTRPAA